MTQMPFGSPMQLYPAAIGSRIALHQLEYKWGEYIFTECLILQKIPRDCCWKATSFWKDDIAFAGTSSLACPKIIHCQRINQPPNAARISGFCPVAASSGPLRMQAITHSHRPVAPCFGAASIWMGSCRRWHSQPETSSQSDKQLKFMEFQTSGFKYFVPYIRGSCKHPLHRPEVMEVIKIVRHPLTQQ